jgi:hypothetical protein
MSRAYDRCVSFGGCGAADSRLIGISALRVLAESPLGC